METLFGSIPSPARSAMVPYGGNVPVHRDARDTERAAAQLMENKVSGLRAMVLRWVRAAGERGLTSKEASRKYAVSLGRDPDDSVSRNSIAPRLTELAQMGFVQDGGLRRERCAAMVATEKSGDPEE